MSALSGTLFLNVEEKIYGLVFVTLKSKIFSKFSVTSNLAAHV